jgi:hypothetical protein
MIKHKWHDEIVAWAGGAEIECFVASEWYGTDYPNWDENNEFRIKPQQKQPKYLYAYIFNGTAMLTETKAGAASGGRYIGKIEVQDD